MKGLANGCQGVTKEFNLAAGVESPCINILLHNPNAQRCMGAPFTKMAFPLFHLLLNLLFVHNVFPDAHELGVLVATFEHSLQGMACDALR